MDDLYFKLAKTETCEDARAMLLHALETETSLEHKNKLAGALAYLKLKPNHSAFVFNLREILFNNFCDVIKLATK